jgi:hypothetical protein
MNTAISRSPRQAKCAICGKLARPGSAIVRHEGAGGRVHQKCAVTQEALVAVTVTAVQMQTIEAKGQELERCHNVAG